MKNNSFIYSDLSKKQLENLKELYIQKKVESMSHQELKQYVLEIISHQIKDTIDKEEEMEAWREMSDFFGDQFEMIILEIQTKYNEDKNCLSKEIDPQKQRLELLEKNNLDQEKKDMWDDQNFMKGIFHLYKQKIYLDYMKRKNQLNNYFCLYEDSDNVLISVL